MIKKFEKFIISLQGIKGAFFVNPFKDIRIGLWNDDQLQAFLHIMTKNLLIRVSFIYLAWSKSKQIFICFEANAMVLFICLPRIKAYQSILHAKRTEKKEEYLQQMEIYGKN